MPSRKTRAAKDSHKFGFLRLQRSCPGGRYPRRQSDAPVQALFIKGKKVKGLIIKTVSIEPVAVFSAKEIRRLRTRLKLSQAVFAGVLGVTDKAVQAWEAGTNQPTGPAARMIDMLERRPEEVVALYLRRNGPLEHFGYDSISEAELAFRCISWALELCPNF